MLTLSREACVKLGKHAWAVYPLEAFGYLLRHAAEESVLAALPCSKTRQWYEYSDRWNGIAESADQAATVARRFGLQVVGVYASEYPDAPIHGEYPPPPAPVFLSLDLILLYSPHCCPGCSGFGLYHRGRWLTRNEDYVVPAGKRILQTVNQKRISKAWRDIHGAVDYSNGYHNNEGSMGGKRCTTVK